VCAHTYIKHVFMCAHTFITHVCVCAHTYTARMHIHVMDTHTQTHTNTYVYTHTHTEPATTKFRGTQRPGVLASLMSLSSPPQSPRGSLKKRRKKSSQNGSGAQQSGTSPSKTREKYQNGVSTGVEKARSPASRLEATPQKSPGKMHSGDDKKPDGRVKGDDGRRQKKASDEDMVHGESARVGGASQSIAAWYTSFGRGMSDDDDDDEGDYGNANPCILWFLCLCCRCLH
jgi:hypothetical protein